MKVKNKTKFYRSNLLLLVFASMAFAVTSRAQSTDMDAPTALTSNIITGEGDGKGESLYYSFTATQGDVKLTLDAKTDNYSTPVEVVLLSEDGKELLQVTAVAGDKMERAVGTKHFVREQKVILRVSTREDKQVKLLTYKIRLEGSLKIQTPIIAPATPAAPDAPATPAIVPDTPVPASAATDPAPANAPPDVTPPAAAAIPAAGAAPEAAVPATPAKQPSTGSKVKEKVKAKAKDSAKKVADGLLN